MAKLVQSLGFALLEVSKMSYAIKSFEDAAYEKAKGKLVRALKRALAEAEKL